MAQLQFGTEGRFGILKQGAFGTAEILDANFHYFPFVSCDYGPVDGQATLPPESGGAALPRGRYKTGSVFSGTLGIIPRLEDRFGWLLEAAVGDASSYADQTIAQVIAGAGATVGVNTHLFLFKYYADASQNQFDIPYLTTHRLLPHRTTASQVGEISQDACITQMQLTVGAAGIAGATFGLLGRSAATTILDINPGWALPTYDDDDTFITTSCTGSVQIAVENGTPGTPTALDAQGATLTFVNSLLPPAQSRVIGNPYHLDHPNMGRSVTIEIPCVVADYNMYMQCFGGAANPVVDTGWSCDIANGDVDITVQSSEVIGVTSAFHMLRFRTTQHNVKWSVRPLVLQPNRPVVCALLGQIDNVSTNLPFYLYVQNGTAAYA